jgi:hypothetical protein
LYSIPTLQKLHTQKNMSTVQSANRVAASHQPQSILLFHCHNSLQTA